jgi:hypothetical protein
MGRDLEVGLAVAPQHWDQGRQHHRHHHRDPHARKDAAAPGHVCPGIRTPAIDIAQPPGIHISPIADMDVHQTIVTAVLSAEEQRRDAQKRLLGSLLGNHAS